MKETSASTVNTSRNQSAYAVASQFFKTSIRKIFAKRTILSSAQYCAPLTLNNISYLSRQAANSKKEHDHKMIIKFN